MLSLWCVFKVSYTSCDDLFGNNSLAFSFYTGLYADRLIKAVALFLNADR